MNRIKGYKLFLEGQAYDIFKTCKKYGISRFTINEDWSVDVDGSVGLSLMDLTKLPLKFGKVTGDFSCYNNKLTSLEGCPKEVGGSFYCANNQLTSLEGSPKVVGGSFGCYKNQLTTLEGGPKEVGGNFHCQDNSLVSLKGSPVRVGGNFNCGGNQLTDLIGVPQIAGGYYFNKNKIRSFEGLPEDFEGHVEFYQNPVQKILWEFPDELWLKVIHLINDYDAIWRGEVVPERLEMVKEKLGLV